MAMIAGVVVRVFKENAPGVVPKDTVAKKVGHLEMDVMGHLVVMTSMLVFLTRLVS